MTSQRLGGTSWTLNYTNTTNVMQYSPMTSQICCLHVRIAGGRTLVSFGLANSIVLVSPSRSAAQSCPSTQSHPAAQSHPSTQSCPTAQSQPAAKAIRVKLLLTSLKAPVPVQDVQEDVQDVDMELDDSDMDQLQEDKLAGDDDMVVSRPVLSIFLF